MKINLMDRTAFNQTSVVSIPRTVINIMVPFIPVQTFTSPRIVVNLI